MLSYLTSALSALVLSLSLTTGVQSGTLGDVLSSRVAAGNSNEMIPVWIKLPPVREAKEFRAAVAAQATTRAERHRIAMQQLQDDHASAQRHLLAELRVLEQRGRAARIEPHWVTNIVEASVAAGELDRLAARSDIQTIYAVPEITIGELTKPIPSPPSATAVVGQNLTLINADQAWAAGFTGQGRLVCSFDTGVDGAHPALFNSWKGHDGDSAAAWFDPADGESFPHPGPTVGTDPAHGTHSMGIIVGHDGTDTIGVALDARWISAAVIDIPGTSIIDAFEWAADPDRDPNSIDDVPDVINHSWGVRYVGCTNLFYDAIDNLEAMGIVNVFAAGNEGLAADAIRNPANDDRDSLTGFAVGSVDQSSTPPPVAPTSSRGPSECRGSTKPNVTAPGVSVKSAQPGGGYQLWGGTSFAVPHVSGLVALLRQKNPNATVDQIKTAILAGAVDYGALGPDNDYGWGVIDCMAALNALPPVNLTPNVRVYAFDHAPISPGDTVAGTVVLQNIGASAGGVTATIIGSDPSLTVLNGSASFGFIAANDTVRSPDIIRVAVSDTITEGSVLALDFLISDADSYNNLTSLYFSVEPLTQRMMATHNANRIQFTITNYGTYGLSNESVFPAGGAGFRVDGGNNDLWEGALMVGINSQQVSDGGRTAAGEPDGDFGVAPGGNLDFLEPGSVADEESYSRFADSRAENPIGLEIAQETYMWGVAPYDDFVILRYVVRNVTGGTINGIHVGLYLDWDVFNYASNAGGWDDGGQFLWTAYNNGAVLSPVRGAKVVQGTVASAFTGQETLTSFPPSGDGFTEQEKYSTLIDGFTTATTYASAAAALMQVLTAGPLDLAPGAEDTVAFALLAGDTQADINDAALQAQLLMDSITTDVDDEPTDLLPTEFALWQNFPNPFNPTTTIRYYLPERATVTLSVYNILGQRVVTLLDGYQKSGYGEVIWDGRDHSGDKVASGVYFYRLSSDGASITRRMMLLK